MVYVDLISLGRFDYLLYRCYSRGMYEDFSRDSFEERR